MHPDSPYMHLSGIVLAATFYFVIICRSMKIINPSFFWPLSSSRSIRPSQTNKKTNMAPYNALTVDDIINGFPTPVLPKINHKPTFEYFQVTNHILNANAISVPSMSGRGSHGHLGINMTQVESYVISSTHWAEPYNPGATPLITAGTNAVDAAQIARLRD
jgi:hypothetical protein